jgi:hypothetical protein
MKKIDETIIRIEGLLEDLKREIGSTFILINVNFFGQDELFDLLAKEIQPTHYGHFSAIKLSREDCIDIIFYKHTKTVEE